MGSSEYERIRGLRNSKSEFLERVISMIPEGDKVVTLTSSEFAEALGAAWSCGQASLGLGVVDGSIGMDAIMAISLQGYATEHYIKRLAEFIETAGTTHNHTGINTFSQYREINLGGCDD